MPFSVGFWLSTVPSRVYQRASAELSAVLMREMDVGESPEEDDNFWSDDWEQH